MRLQLQRRGKVRQGRECCPAEISTPTAQRRRSRSARNDLRCRGYRLSRPKSVSWWLNRDPIGERGGRNLYVFVGNDPIGAYDADGRIKVTTLTKNPTTTCGDHDVAWDFVLDKNTPEDGYIVQKITYTWEYEQLFANPSAKPEKVAFTKVYWEAWLVKSGETQVTSQKAAGRTDGSGGPKYSASKGKLSSTGEIKFFFKKKTGDLGDIA